MVLIDVFPGQQYIKAYNTETGSYIIQSEDVPKVFFFFIEEGLVENWLRSKIRH